MGLIVQKYGGTSVGSVKRIQAVAQRILKTVKGGNSVVVVVSAMGKTTDYLVKIANKVSDNPCEREMDMLLSTGEQVSIALVTMALQQLGQPAISLTGAQVGIITETEHTCARILGIKTCKIERYLNDDKVVVVAGFQGVCSLEELEITTLGRGGSDTSAVALAAALKADVCEIYTDVPGILTADPRIVENAQLTSEINCDEMLELASLGAKVLHPRAVKIARYYGVPLVVRSCEIDAPGTKIVSPTAQRRSLNGIEISSLPVERVEFDLNQAKVALLRIPNYTGLAARLFNKIAHQGIDVGLIFQSLDDDNTTDITFTVTQTLLRHAEAVIAAIVPVLITHLEPKIGTPEILVEPQIAKLSVVKADMSSRKDVVTQVLATLAAVNVNIQFISTSERKVTCVIAEKDCKRAVTALCHDFKVNSYPSSLQEELISSSILFPQFGVRGVALDTNQARLAIRDVPDELGKTAQLFGALAEQNIDVDMIFQSQTIRELNGFPMRSIAFTVARTDVEAVKETLEKIAPFLGFRDIVVEPTIAKVSAVGARMLGNCGIAARMFEALSQAQINIQMIATSEIKVSCIVAQAQGAAALRAVHAAFGLSN